MTRDVDMTTNLVIPTRRELDPPNRPVNYTNRPVEYPARGRARETPREARDTAHTYWMEHVGEYKRVIAPLLRSALADADWQCEPCEEEE